LLEPGDLVVLAGELGAGKTFLARAICRGAGVPHEEPITSPTFTLVHEHRGRVLVAHADLYRIENEADLAEIGLRELRAEAAALAVEGGARYESALGGDALVVSLLLPRADEPRTAELSATGPRGDALRHAILT